MSRFAVFRRETEGLRCGLKEQIAACELVIEQLEAAGKMVVDALMGSIAIGESRR
jgi:hypothetical protein